MSSIPPRFRVAIVGAGLGGLLLALLLQKNARDLHIDVYESAAELTETGVGIGMWPRMWEIMESLGLDEELLEVCGGRDPGALPIHCRKADQEEQMEVFRFPPVLYTFHRSVLQTILSDNIDKSTVIHFAKRLVSFTDNVGEGASIDLHFEDSTKATCDLLVGSDGIRSAVRRTMFNGLANEADSRGQHEEASRLRSMVDAVWSGEVAYRGLIPTSTLTGWGFKDAEIPMFLIGKDKNVVQYPISRGKFFNVAAFVNHAGGEGTVYDGPWVSKTTGRNVAEQFATWTADVRKVLKSMEDPLCWAVHTVRELPTYVHSRVALMGDAAHAMTPHQGAGASQAVEDAFILATILSQPSVNSRQTLSAALSIYDEIRRPFSQEIQRRSRTNGQLYQLKTLGWGNVTAAESAAGGFPPERLHDIGKMLEGQFAWSLGESIMQDRDRALEMVRRGI